MDYTWMPMHPELYSSLIWLWENRKFPESAYVFVDSHPGPNYGQRFTVRRKFMHAVCERAGVRPFGFHALRRFVASVLVDTHKASLKQVQLILRHKKQSTTERYIHNIDRGLEMTLNLLSIEKMMKKSTRSGTDDENGLRGLGETE
jgi:integrase